MRGKRAWSTLVVESGRDVDSHPFYGPFTLAMHYNVWRNDVAWLTSGATAYADDFSWHGILKSQATLTVFRNQPLRRFVSYEALASRSVQTRLW